MKLAPLPCAPWASPLTRLVLPVLRSRTKTSLTVFVSPPTRLFATELNATKRPLAEIDGTKLAPFPCAPWESTLTRLVLPAFRSRTNTSLAPFVSPPTRLLALDRNATKRPSAEIDAAKLSPLPCAPSELTLTRVVLPVFRSGTKTTLPAAVSPTTTVGPPVRNG